MFSRVTVYLTLLRKVMCYIGPVFSSRKTSSSSMCRMVLYVHKVRGLGARYRSGNKNDSIGTVSRRGCMHTVNKAFLGNYILYCIGILISE